MTTRQVVHTPVRLAFMVMRPAGELTTTIP
jgi:hypothetical protein